jgi:spermidine synthase
LINLHDTLGLILFFTISYGVIAVIGILSGFELPILIHLREQEKEGSSNLVLGVDYFASLAGAVVFALFLLPYFGVLRTGLITATFNVSAALVLLSQVRGTAGRSFRLFWASNVSILLVLVLLSSLSPGIDQYLLKKYYYAGQSSENLVEAFSPMGEWPDVERYRSRYQNIDIVVRQDSPLDRLVYSSYSTKYEIESGFPNDYVLYLNGNYQFASSFEEIYHEYFIHVPIIANQVPKKVLVLGGGDGLLVRELLKYEEVESITLVDIDPNMIELSMTHPVLRRMNKGSLGNPKVTAKIMDAFYFVKTNKVKFDAIFIDFPKANDYNLSKLYSMEFYSLVGKSLENDGFAVIDAPYIDIGLPENDLLIYYNTIKAAGFDTIVPYVTLLERDNAKLNEALIDEPEATRLMIAEQTEYLLHAIRSEFIMMKSEDSAINMEYADYGVEMYVLNEERYRSAFNIFYHLPETVDRNEINLIPEKVDWSKVNSIMRPILPSASPFSVNVP